MAWYYGVNDSELYGSNFSTLLADAPPPLDDTYDEDENEIVFPNEVKKLKKFNGETTAASSNKTHSSDEKLFTDKSKHDGSSSRPPEGQSSVEEDSDFGDFAGFADFGSAFGQENSGGSRDWFSGDENNVNSPPAVKTATSNQGHDNEVADFAAFAENEGSVNQENITNGGFEQGSSNLSDNKKKCYNSENRNNSINGSYDMDSDDDFGDFASVEKSTGRSEKISTEDESKAVEIQPNLERSCAPMGRSCSESDLKSEGVAIKSERKIAHYNGDTADEGVVSHWGESTVNHTLEGFSNVDKGQDNELGAERDNNNVKNVSNAMAKDEGSRPLDKTFVAVGHENNHPSDSDLSKPEREDDKIENTVEGKITSSSKGNESLEKAKTLPEDNELNDDGFGEFADFTGPMVKQPSADNDDDEEKDELCDKQMPRSPVISVPAGDGNEDSSCVQVASVQNKGDNDEFGDFGSFDEGHGQNYERTTGFIAVDSRTECVSTQKSDDDDDDDFGEFGSSNNAGNTLPPEAQDSDDFGDFGSFKSETKDFRKVDDGKDNSEDFGISNSKGKTLSSEDQSAGDFSAINSRTKDSHNEDDDGFGDFGTSSSGEKTLQCKDQDSADFGDFGAFNSRTKDSHNEDDDGFGDFGTSSSGEKTLECKNQDSDDFGDFGTFNSRTKDSHNNDDDSFGDFGSSNSGEKSLPTGDHDKDDFGNFGAFDSSTKDSQKESDVDNEFGDFGSFETNTKKNENNSANFGSFESNTKDDQSGDSSTERFADFGAFNGQPKDLSDKNGNDFDSFESRVKDLAKGEQRSSNAKDLHTSELKGDSKFEDFNRTSDSPDESQRKKNLQSDEIGASNSVSKNINNSRESSDDFGNFSSGEGKEGTFATFPTSRSESLPRRNEDLKQRGTSASCFVPGNNVIIKQVEDTFSPCFISEQRHISHCHCDVLSSRVEKSLESNMGLWQQLERCDKEGRIVFHWSNSFSKHKKLLSLTIRPDRPPPLQAGTMLKPTVSSQLTPFGGGLPGSMLMPQPYSKLPQSHSPSGLIKGFSEPVKGSYLPSQSHTLDKMSSHQSAHPTHPEIGLPDLSFVLGNGIKPTTSKSDIKDNVSDTTSESSSLDLDFFAPSTTQPSEGKPGQESRGLYEEDLLGLNIFSSSLEPQKSDGPKPQKTSDTKKVWQRGGVTIPLSSQESRAQLSPAAKSILDELEDLRFMSSSVLMFPLKS